MTAFLRMRLLPGVLLLFALACAPDLPSHPFVGTWSSKAGAQPGYVLVVKDNNALEGVITLKVNGGAEIAQPFSDGRWEVSGDNKFVLLDFGTAISFGEREYELLSPLDHDVVRLRLREKDNPEALLIELSR